MRTLKSRIFEINLVAMFVFAILAGLGYFDPALGALGAFPLIGLGVNRAPGHPDYEASGPNKNIPWIFSKKTVAKFYDKAVVTNIANTDYEGEIKGQGSKVIINTIPSVAIRKYVKGGTTIWQDLASPAVELDIDKAADFAFKMDKIDIKQFAINMMDKLSDDAGQQMKIYIDEEVLGSVYADAAAANKGITAGRKSSAYNLGTTGSSIPLSKTNIVDSIMMCEAVADEQNWPEEGRWMVIPTWAKFLINTSELKDASLTGEGTSRLLTGGRLGQLGNFMLHVTNLYTSVTDGGNTCYNIMFGHKSALTFAAQLTEMEFFEKLETTYGSGMKGLNVYGFKTIKPESMGILYARKG